MNRRRQSGMSLIQVMIAAALLGVIALGIASVVRNSATSLKRSTTMSIRRRLVDRFHDIARSRESITNTVAANATLRGHTDGSSPQPLTNMTLDPPSPTYAIRLRDSGDNTIIPTGGLFLNRDGGICSPACNATNGYWIVRSAFAAKAANDFEILTTVEQNPRVFDPTDPLYDVEAIRLKTELSSSAAGASGISRWTLVGTRIENNNSGQVRVITSFRNTGVTQLDGNTNIGGRLTVNSNAVFNANSNFNGNINVTGANNASVGGNLNVGGSTTVGSLTTGAVTSTTVTANRLVGNNGVQVGTSGAACNAGNQGLMRFNTGSNQIEYCNGSSYVNLISGSREVSVYAGANVGSSTLPNLTINKQGNAATSYLIVQGNMRLSNFDTGGCSGILTVRLRRNGANVHTSTLPAGWHSGGANMNVYRVFTGLGAGNHTFDFTHTPLTGPDCAGPTYGPSYLTVREVPN